MAEAPFEEGGDSAAMMELLQQRAEGKTNFSLRCTKDRKVTTGVTVLTVVLLLTVTIIVLAAKKHPPCTTPALPSCPESGIGFGDKCFYFLEEEVDWEGSQRSCLSHQAHLATIDTREELHFLLRYGNFMEYWVGLRREGSGPWKWLNGSLFNALFDIQGNGHCAYTNSHRISSDRCSETKFSICSHLQRHPSEVQKDPEILNST
ncbi:C-type lectin domain family 2 member D-like [Corvus kubaryi]|uniref:C-type lectin domain family 2 member D-like n=1 Tax=Corvus kubaryi TaxID=68294 RepID=UPI001C03E596|nr:C-type lectin domain family 2 member D-like [Corvus kubaryi]XP_041876072.1 C-type lectin domain family 2 member D-like [Corvus kubaryi]XP_041876073.1 C-type lectin domain family 2 member D-like [Corvus kubaryi]